MDTDSPLPKLPEKPEQILILDKGSNEVESAIGRIIDQLPTVEVTRTGSVEKYKEIVGKGDFDIVIFDYDVSGDIGIDLIHELMLKDYEPAVLIVSTSVETKVFTDIYNYGSHRYIVKNGRWLEEIGPAVRHLLRIRKLENENRNLLAKLTEANAMLGDKNRRLDQFSATLAHDIRGPLGGICMKLEYVLETYGHSFDDKLKGLLSRAAQSSERLTHIVQAMYDFAKLGSKAATMRHLNLRVLIDEVISDLSFDEKLNISIGMGELPEVWGNPELLRQVFSNLISNAVKYNDKPEIVINIGLRRIDERTLAHFAEVFVEDNGAGIDSRDIRDIFTIFNRGSASKGGKEGLGLGLSTVQRIVELHFGRVWVESEKGKGSTFILSIPVDEISFVK